MRLAIIDLGTNSVRFDIHELRANKKPRLLYREKLMVRLGQDVFLKAHLDTEAKKRCLLAFKNFQKTLKEFRVTKVSAFATATLREARDGNQFIEQVKRRSGIELKLISGSEEARLIAIGILKNEKTLKGDFALVDIGGGSTEISIHKKSKITHSDSFKLGAAKLQQIFLKNSPPFKITPQDDPCLRLKNSVKQSLEEVMYPENKKDHWPKVNKVIGSSGTIRSLSKMIGKKETGKNIPLKELSKLIKKIQTMSFTELIQVPRMELKRVDMILSGALLLEQTMKTLGAKTFRGTPYSLRDGILVEEASIFKGIAGQHLKTHLDLFKNKARQLGAPKQHYEQVLALAEKLFDGTKKLHKLDPDWKSFLSAAAILHDVGDAIQAANHAEHSYYIIKNSDFSIFEAWEKEFVARLCLHHASQKLPEKSLRVFKSKELKSTFKKLLALLRVADALDRGHKAKTQIKKIRINKQEVVIELNQRKNAELEILRLEHKKQLFEKIYKHKIKVL